MTGLNVTREFINKPNASIQQRCLADYRYGTSYTISKFVRENECQDHYDLIEMSLALNVAAPTLIRNGTNKLIIIS